MSMLDNLVNELVPWEMQQWIRKTFQREPGTHYVKQNDVITSGGLVNGVPKIGTVLGPAPEEPKQESSMSVPTIQDQTQTNVETNINPGLNFDRGMLDYYYERENEQLDKLMDFSKNAYTYAVQDMRRAGINPNLMNVTPASVPSAPSATKMDYNAYEGELNKYLTEYEKEMEKALKEWETFMNQTFEGKENEKDRINETVNKLLSNFGIGILLKFIGG